MIAWLNSLTIDDVMGFLFFSGFIWLVHGLDSHTVATEEEQMTEPNTELREAKMNRWFLWDCWIWLKVRIWPDKRPSAVLLDEVRERLSQMPAGKEIHEVFRHLDAFEKDGSK